MNDEHYRKLESRRRPRRSAVTSRRNSRSHKARGACVRVDEQQRQVARGNGTFMPSRILPQEGIGYRQRRRRQPAADISIACRLFQPLLGRLA